MDSQPNGERQGWTGFRGKTLWDWMQLLFVPVFIAGAAAFLSFLEIERSAERARLQQESDERRAEQQREIDRDRAQQTILDNYIQVMTSLLLEEGLATAEPNELVREIARANTLSAVRQLDSERKGILVGFLYESGLIGAVHPDGELTESILDLVGANLSGANLTGARMPGANLSETNLSQADLSGAFLDGIFLDKSDLGGADLADASMSEAYLSGSNLSRANLRGIYLHRTLLERSDLSRADLSNASLLRTILTGANLSQANLSRAFLDDADLLEADLSGANLSEAGLYNVFLLTNQQLAEASSLIGATLPDGTVILTEEQEQAFKEQWGQ